MVRVEDSSGERIPNVVVQLNDPTDPGSFFIQTTNGVGEARFRGPPERKLRAQLMHGSKGMALDMECDATGEDTVLILAAEEEIRLLLADGDQALLRGRGRSPS